MTNHAVSSNVSGMGRRQITYQTMTTRFGANTFERIDEFLRPSESRAEFVRQAVEAEIDRRAKAVEFVKSQETEKRKK